MKKIILLFLTMCMTVGMSAQKEVTVKTFEEATFGDISAKTNRRFDLNHEACALIKVQYPKPGATFEGLIVGDVERRNGEYWVYMGNGAKRLKVHLPDTPTISVEFSEYEIDGVASNVTYNLAFLFPSDFHASFYVEAGMFVGGTMGPEVAVGAYLGGVNIELNATLPLSKSNEVYWNKGAQASAVCTYKPQFSVGGRVGYGIMAGEKLRITPQVGVKFLKTAETVASGSASEIASGAYCSSLLVAVKLQYMLTKSFGISLSPEYDMHIMSSDGFKALSEVSPKIKKWNNGIGVKFAANIEF